VWSSSVRSGRKILDHDAAYAAFERMRMPGVRWPLFAFYGRMSRGTPTLLVKGIPDRCEGYLSSLDSAKTDTALLTWMLEEFLADSVRRQNNEPEQGLVAVVLEIAVRAAPYLKGMWYDPRERSPVVRFVSGEVLAWSDLPDGYHSHLSLIIDIARRAMMLNGQDGGLAPSKIEGVVLIDKISLRLHPRRQRVILDGLREIFPYLQFVVTTPENDPLEASPKVA